MAKKKDLDGDLKTDRAQMVRVMEKSPSGSKKKYEVLKNKKPNSKHGKAH